MTIRVAFLLCITIILLSCNDFADESGISGGTIEYRISYLGGRPGDKDVSLMPKKMKLIFDRNEAVNFIEGFMGMYGMNNITNFDTRKSTTILKVFDRHYIYKGKREEFMCCFDAMEDMQISETTGTTNIAGLNCRKAIVTLPSEGISFDIYYTHDISLKHPNQNNPYRLIDGVLMKFELRMLDMRMEFTAESFQPGSGPGKKPEIPKNGIDVNRAQMSEIIKRLME